MKRTETRCPANRLCATGHGVLYQTMQAAFLDEIWDPLDACHAGGPLDAPLFAPAGYTYRDSDPTSFSSIALHAIVMLDGRAA